MKRILSALAAFALLCAMTCGLPGVASAQQAQPLTRCGAITYTANGEPRPITQTPDGRQCGNPAYNPVASTSYETSHVICAAACDLATFQINPDSTLGGAAYNVLFLDATSDPGNGAVAPKKCYQGTSTGIGGTFAPAGLHFVNGLVIVASTAASCFTETQSAHAYISADKQ